jgi:hypothetical protein
LAFWRTNGPKVFNCNAIARVSIVWNGRDFSLFAFCSLRLSLSPTLPRSMKVGKAAIIIRFSTARWSIVGAAAAWGAGARILENLLAGKQWASPFCRRRKPRQGSWSRGIGRRMLIDEQWQVFGPPFPAVVLLVDRLGADRQMKRSDVQRPDYRYAVRIQQTAEC